MLHTKIFITICSILLLYLVLLLEFMDDDPILEKSETIALDSLQAQEFNPEPVSTKWPRNKTRCLAPEHGKSGQIKEKQSEFDYAHCRFKMIQGDLMIFSMRFL